MADSFLSGAIFMAYLALSAFFARFWQQTQDRFFLLFAAAFLALSAERIVLLLLDSRSEAIPYAYFIRLVAFLTIIGAIVDKNRR